MRIAICIYVALLVASQSIAESVWIDSSHSVIERPDRIGQIKNQTDAQLADFGIVQSDGPDGVDQRFWTWGGSEYVSMPQVEIDAIVAADAAAAAEAALYPSTDPEALLPVIRGSVTNVIGKARGFIDADTEEFDYTTEVGSPKHTTAQQDAERAEKKAAKAFAASECASLAAQVKAAKGTPAQIAAIVAYVEKLEASIGRSQP